MGGTPRKKAMSKMTSWSIVAETLWRATSANGETGRAEIGSGMRVTVRSRDANDIVQKGVDGIGLGVWYVKKEGWGLGCRKRDALDQALYNEMNNKYLR